MTYSIGNGQIFNKPEAKKILKAIYSDAEINYKHSQIQSVTSLDIDRYVTNSVKSTENLSHEITQLLVDIQVLDNQDFHDWAKKNKDKPFDESKSDIRLKRFTNAFNSMFEYKK